MAKSLYKFLKKRPEWLRRVSSLIVLAFVLALLIIIGIGSWNLLGIVIIIFIVLLIILYGAYFIAEAIFSYWK